MGAGAVSGHQNHSKKDYLSASPSHTRNTGSSTPHRESSHTSSGHSGSSGDHIKYTMKMSCEMCSTNFTLFKRKKFCQECHRYFCSTCLPKPPSSSPIGRQCSKCRLLISGRFTRKDLEDWKVKDIRCFLDVHNVSTKSCREKRDLVELVLSKFCKDRRGSFELQAEHEIFVQQMAAHLILDDSASEPASPTGQRSNGNAATGTNMENYNFGYDIGNLSSSSASNQNTTLPENGRENQASTQQEASRSRDSGDNTSSTEKNATSQGQPKGRGEDERGDTFTSFGQQQLRDLLHQQFNQYFNCDLSNLEIKTDRQDSPIQPSPTRLRLDDIKSLEEIEGLTVRQIKEVLVNNFVDYKGCCEKAELMERVKRLWMDSQESKRKADQILKADESASALATGSNSAESATTVPTTGSNSAESATTVPTTGSNIAESATTVPTTSSSSSSSNEATTASTSSPNLDIKPEPSLPSQPTPSSSPSKTVQEDRADSLCRICMDAITNCILLECGHMVTCTTCGRQLAECPICRQYISRVVRVFRS